MEENKSVEYIGMLRKTFVQSALNGEIFDLNEIDEFIEAWHESNSKVPIHEWLGFTSEEYSEFLDNPRKLHYILKRRIK